MNKRYRITAIAMCLSAALSIPPAMADDSAREAGPKEMIGLGTGSLLGALVGGPPGLVIGAIGGILIGQNQDAAQQITERDQDLRDSRRRVSELQRDIKAQHVSAVSQQQQTAERQTSLAAAAIARGFVYAVQFRSDSAELEPHYRHQLQQLAGTLVLFDRLDIHLSGHADPTGSDAHNLALSRQRVIAVRDQLLRAGVDASRILHRVHGERLAMARQDDSEARFFDRRVQICFSVRDEPLKTAGRMDQTVASQLPGDNE